MTDHEIQTYLRTKGYYRGAIDGIFGIKTWQAVLDLLQVRRSELIASPYRWSRARRKLAVKQLMCKDSDIEVGAIDGLMGPQTRYALAVFKDPDEGNWRDDDHKGPTTDRPDAEKWPTQSQVRTNSDARFGRPGTNQVMLQLPYPMVLAWDSKVTISRFSCHKKVHDSLQRIFTRTLEYYGDEGIKSLRLNQYGGCLNVRKVRGGSLYSMHSWGIAVDLDPVNNRLRWGRDKASLAQPMYDKFWEFVEAEGAVSLGRVRNYDWMHFQFARL